MVEIFKQEGWIEIADIAILTMQEATRTFTFVDLRVFLCTITRSSVDYQQH
jgi:hypothetical protein